MSIEARVQLSYYDNREVNVTGAWQIDSMGNMRVEIEYDVPYLYFFIKTLTHYVEECAIEFYYQNGEDV